MSEQALQAAQLTQAQNECVQLKTMTRNMSGQLGAQKQCLDEFLASNVGLRAANLILEDDVRNLRAQVNQTVERVNVLEKEKAELAAKLAELQPASDAA